MNDAKQQLADKLKSANNILVTVSRDPSVDQLSALLGLTLLLNKQGKHAVAVFSGQVPSTIEFLQPEETIQKNTDSLRDFIIALDKNKADKLRYKVEDNVVRIFITPYRTSISQEDFDFSQGDFNVDVVVALGVRRQEDLDEAITAHGRILHDATVATIDLSNEGDIGVINWHVPQASSLSELVTDLGQTIDGKLMDEQIATALLTGIVSATNRFSNEKTNSQALSMSAILMAAGANQQLVTSQLAEMAAAGQGDNLSASQQTGNDDGTLEIDHPVEPAKPHPSVAPVPAVEPVAPPKIEASPAPPPMAEPPSATQPSLVSNLSPGSRLITEPPTLGGTLTANSSPPALDPVTDPLSLPSSEAPHLLDHQSSSPADSPQPPPGPGSSETLDKIEKAVDSPHIDNTELKEARDEVDQALNAQPLGGDLHPQGTSDQVIITQDGALLPAPPNDDDSTTSDIDEDKPSGAPPPPLHDDSSTPPPVPPPIPFQFGGAPS